MKQNQKNISIEKAQKEAYKILDEIAADVSHSSLRAVDRFLRWLWNKLYSGIDVQNSNRVRKLALEGHEIVYVPCHRSHIDYLLLSYVLYHQGLVPPHIAAGINLNFWPIGRMFRSWGAFFIRRTFKEIDYILPFFANIYQNYSIEAIPSNILLRAVVLVQVVYWHQNRYDVNDTSSIAT